MSRTRYEIPSEAIRARNPGPSGREDVKPKRKPKKQKPEKIPGKKIQEPQPKKQYDLPSHKQYK